MDFMLRNVRLAFPNLFEAKEYKPGDGRPRFDATFLIGPGSENDKAVRAAIKQEATNTYGQKAELLLKQWENNPNKYAYLNGDLKDYDGYAGMMYLSCHSKVKPATFDNVRDPDTGKAREIKSETEGRLYAGCYVNAKVSIYAQKGENAGIRASMSGIQFCRDGDAFSAGRPASADEFEALDDYGATGTDDLV